jgi:hypothetical protein
MLDDRHHEIATVRGEPECRACDEQRRYVRSDTLGIDAGARLTVDDETVAPNYYGGVDARSIAQGREQVANR